MAGLAGYLTACYVRDFSGGGDALFHAACGAAFALIVYAGAAGAQTGIWHRASSRGFLPWVGLVTYSLYIWHEPLLLTLAGRGLLPEQAAASLIPTTAVLLVLSLFVAWVSYWVIEHPASQLRFFFGDAPSGRLQAERRSAP